MEVKCDGWVFRVWMKWMRVFGFGFRSFEILSEEKVRSYLVVFFGFRRFGYNE